MKIRNQIERIFNRYDTLILDEIYREINKGIADTIREILEIPVDDVTYTQVWSSVNAKLNEKFTR